MKKRLLFIFPILIVVFVGLMAGSGCANIIPPAGGPRDSLPPRLVHASPPDSTVNFKGKTITLTFDEYVDLQEVQQNLLFTPTFANVPVIAAKLRTITIRLKDTLEANTTYTFNFGNAVRDINEANILRNFTYTFSTGPVLDSLTLNGKVILAENGKTDSTLIVILHNTFDDSAVVNKRPRYVARVDGSGNFKFKNLPPGNFAVYALGDAGGGRRYLNKSQLFAFASEPVKLPAAAPVVLYAYKEVSETTTPVTAAGGKAMGSDKRLKFTTNATGGQQDLMKDLTLTFDRPLRSFDSTKMILTTDSAFNAVTNYKVVLDTTRKVVAVQTPWQQGKRYNLVLQKDFAEDTLHRKLLKSDTLFFVTKKENDYGAVTIRLRNIDTTKHPVLQFVQNDQVVYSAPVASGYFRQKLFAPGDYQLRILYDTNNNGKWDPGHFFGTKRQPELVYPITQSVNIKGSWNNEFERGLTP